MLSAGMSAYSSGVFSRLRYVIYLSINVHADEIFLVPIYPVAYVVTGSWGIHNIWFCLFLAWMVKLAILQYDGLRAHQQATPFFLGLILENLLLEAHGQLSV